MTHRVSIVGIGQWLPSRIVANDAWPASFSEAAAKAVGARTFNDIPAPLDAVAAAIVERDLLAEAKDPFLGADLRHVADADATADQAEAEAARAALADAGIDAREVDVLLSNSLVPERPSPPTATAVAHRIGAVNAMALGVDAVCASAVAQLDVARAYLASGQARVVVLTQSHLVTRLMPRLHPAAPGLGDAAAALVLTRDATTSRVRPSAPPPTDLELLSTFGMTHGEFADAVVMLRAEESPEPPWWLSGGPYRMGSLAPAQVKLLMRDTVDFAAQTIREAARRAGVDVERIAVLAAVQPRGFLPHAMAERLGLPRAAAVETYDTIAHVGAVGPSVNLFAARARGAWKAGDLVAMYAQGAGFTRAAAILRVGS